MAEMPGNPETEKLEAALAPFRDYICRETLTQEFGFTAIPGVKPVELNLNGLQVLLYVQKLAPTEDTDG